MSTRHTIDGCDELIARLARLPDKLQRDVYRPALKSGAKVLATAIAAGAPAMKPRTAFGPDKTHSPPGTLKGAIKVVAGRRKKGYMSQRAAIDGKSFAGVYFYPAPLTYGHKIVIPRRGGGSVRLGRKTAPVPFMAQGFASAESTAASAVKTQLAAGIVKAARA